MAGSVIISTTYTLSLFLTANASFDKDLTPYLYDLYACGVSSSSFLFFFGSSQQTTSIIIIFDKRDFLASRSKKTHQSSEDGVETEKREKKEGSTRVA